MVQVTYLGHASFMLKHAQHVIYIDPWFTGNPSTSGQPSTPPTLIIVTHGHGDHLGDAVELAKRYNVPVLTNFELANILSKQGVNAQGAYMGGKIAMPFGWVKFVPAFHGSGTPDGQYGGVAMGVLINIGGQTIYHAGDTCLTVEMQLLSRYGIALAMLPIGGYFTMDIEEAVEAVKMIKPQRVVPMHYNTFPLIKADPDEFKRQVSNQVPGVEVIVMQPAQTINLGQMQETKT